MKLIIWLLKSIGIYTEGNLLTSSPKRKLLKDVKIGDNVIIEWNRVHGGIATLTCLNNDPKTKSIYLNLEWKTPPIGCLKNERHIIKYNDIRFKNFHLLNSCNYKIPGITEDDNISNLKKILGEYLKEEKYEKANELKNKIQKELFEDISVDDDKQTVKIKRAKQSDVINPTNSDDDDTNIALLQKKINEAMESGDSQTADELQKKIDKLLKK